MDFDYQVNIDIDVKCDDCGQSLETNFFRGAIYVKPCEFCLANELKKGYNIGKERGDL